MMKFINSLALLFLFTVPSLSDSLPKPVKTEIKTSVSEINPGQLFKIGVLFKIDPRWHISWKNPGDSGLPTKVHFILPKGFTAGEIQWPVPLILKRPGDITDYGYENAVFLSADVSAPNELSLNTTIPIRAEVAWTSCSYICIPGKANLETTISVSDLANRIDNDLFAYWERRLPISSDSPKSPFIANVNGKIDNQHPSSNFAITLDWKTKPQDVQWLPAAGNELEIKNISITSDSDTTKISFIASVYQGQKLSKDNLESLVAFTNNSGYRRGVNLLIPLDEKIN
ncbi:hypothetical protein MYX76_15680 [Desulfobacterota bacterium AH_259_B03_O07]|nr:hypothetical protein [Desulfobacterota bacterium AH_259_B03_O07]